jgi:hypothetical protein
LEKAVVFVGAMTREAESVAAFIFIVCGSIEGKK